MAKENACFEFRRKNIYERRNDLLEEIKHNDFMSEKHKKMCTAFNYFGNFLLFTSGVSLCVLISAFSSLIGIPIGISSFSVGLQICMITAGIKKCKSIIKKIKKKHNKIVLLAKARLNAIEILISKILVDLYINHDKFVSVNNVLREYNEEIKTPETSVEYTI